jgi:hypothetical protein
MENNSQQRRDAAAATTSEASDNINSPPRLYPYTQRRAYLNLDGDEVVPPSPPYTAAAATTSSRFELAQDNIASPAYKSRSNLDLSMDAPSTNEERGQNGPRLSHDDDSDEKAELREQLQNETPESVENDEGKNTAATGKPVVHYRDDVQHVEGSYANTPAATNTPSLPLYEPAADGPSSQPPSIAGTDDEGEEDEFDWSAEDDLADEEAKFERQAGIKRKQHGWGFKRSVLIAFITPCILFSSSRKQKRGLFSLHF